jgi:hypothetical protein
MAPRLSPEDYRLLDELNRSGGTARISDGQPRHGADRLVDAGLATSRSLNLSDVEYEMTPLGRKAHVLRQHGIVSTDIETIEPHQSDTDGLWYVKVCCPGDSGGFDNRQQRSEPRCPFAQCACDRPCRPLPGTNRSRAPIRRECGLTVASWPELAAASRRRGPSIRYWLIY